MDDNYLFLILKIVFYYFLWMIESASSVTSIESCAFAHCCSLKKITIPSLLTKISKYTFIGCINLIEINLPSSLTIIGKEAFSECKSLTHIEIPSSVMTIESYAISHCLFHHQFNQLEIMHFNIENH